MSLPQEIPQSTIDELRAKIQEKRSVAPITESNRELLRKKRSLQLQWLETFKRCLSPAITCSKLEIPTSTYRSWRQDPEFAELYNNALADIREELQGAALVRAIGSHQTDELGNPLYDAQGRPIYVNGSDRLAVALLGLEKKEASAPVSVTIEIVSRRDKD